MNEKLYKAFNEDIRDVTFPSIDENKRRMLAMEPYNEFENSGLDRYEEVFITNFTYESNAIEGSTLTLQDTALVLEGEFTPSSDKRLRDIFAARGCADGYAFIEKALIEGRTLDENLIKDIHEKTALDMQPATRGMYRLSPVYIRGSRTVPVDYYSIRELMPALIYMYNDSDAHPVAKAAAFHAMFENIHPFQDGNGRTGRLLLNYMLRFNGYPPIAIKNVAKEQYLKSLEEWQVDGNPDNFLKLVEKCIQEEQQERMHIVEVTRRGLKECQDEKEQSEEEECEI